MSQWKTIPTINDTTPTKEKTKAYNKRVKVMIDKAPVYEGSEEDIKKKIKEHQEELFLKQKAEEDKLLDAFANKKLKSKAAIKKALGLSKKRNDAGKKADKTANPQDNIAVEGQ